MMSSISLSSTSRQSKHVREPLGDVTNTQKSKRGRISAQDDQISTCLFGKKFHLKRWVPERDLLDELNISIPNQSPLSARKIMKQMLGFNKIPFVRLSNGQAKPLTTLSHLPVKGNY